MSKYKVGDKVRISKTIVNQLMLGDMADWLGKTVTISNVKFYRDDGVGYEVEENYWSWGEENLEPVEQSTEFVYEHSEEKEMVHHPSHYQLHKHECIEEMIALFGIEAVIGFCKCNIHKYRYRASGKDGERDLHKADEYMDILLDLEKRR